MLNRAWYSFGNPFKVKFREHYCYRCGTRLSIIEHRKIVSDTSDEAKYYYFSDATGDTTVGPCMFIHKVFYCPKCLRNIEFVTQLNQEDIAILIESVQKHFANKGRKITIKKCFESILDEMEQDCKLEFVKNLCLVIEEEGKESLVYKIPRQRKKRWERPYYFKVNKKDLIRFIQK